VRQLLSDKDGARPRGAIKSLAQALKCHSTFIAHVLSEKAEFSTEQGLRVCRHFGLDSDETAYFLDLLHRDRSGDTVAKAYFDELLNQRRADRQNLKKRLKVGSTLSDAQESTYYRNWLPPAVHMVCQLPGKHTAESIAERLAISRRAAERAIAELLELGILATERHGLVSAVDSIHLGKDSPFVNRSHRNWRHKTAEELDQTPASLPGLHYSAVVSLSEADAARLREIIMKHIEATRRVIIPSPAEELYVQCLDFYRLGTPP
jgi:hypothetical protein